MSKDAFRGLRIYNTLTRTKEDFIPSDPADVRVYVCGPTVYDFAHIGNARPAIVFDVLYRLLRHLYGEDHVTYVRNITDVDDKINARALRDFGAEIDAGRMTLNDAIRAVTEKTADQYHKDVAALGCLPPTHEPRATEHIAGMVAMIQRLLGNANAYVATGGEGAEVLFDTSSMAEYGQLSKRRLEDQQAGARIDVKDHKRNPADFVLWKESSASEPGWEGTFQVDGKAVAIHGRPGWHIECSVMSRALLGETFDIHGGGLDLIFPHHENEIAQSRCAHGTDVMARYWMHNGFLQVEGQKMSKSLGNFVTIHELLETEKFGGFMWPGAVVRYAMLKTHYRQPIDFSVASLEEASTELSRLWHDAAWVDDDVSPSKEFLSALCDDLNFPRAIAELHRHSANSHVYAKNINRGHKIPDASAELDSAYTNAAQVLANLRLVGIDLRSYNPTWVQDRAKKSLEASSAEAIEASIQERLAFIREKNWAEADKIRDELLAEGIQLKDGKDPETGERVTTWEVKR